MGVRLNTNTSALALARNLNQGSEAIRSSVEKVSSGSRIQRAGDDAAALSISSGLNAEARSRSQGLRNASDGISMLQVAESAYGTISAGLIHLRELAIQSASDTVGSAARNMIEAQAQMALDTIDSIARSTSYNGKKLLSSFDDDMHIHLGNSANDEEAIYHIDRSAWRATRTSLGLDEVVLWTRESASESLEMIDRAINRVSKRRAEIGSLQNRITAGIAEAQNTLQNKKSMNAQMSDADMAFETADLLRNKVANDARAAIAGQANSRAAVALKLLE